MCVQHLVRIWHMNMEYGILKSQRCRQFTYCTGRRFSEFHITDYIHTSYCMLHILFILHVACCIFYSYYMYMYMYILFILHYSNSSSSSMLHILFILHVAYTFHISVYTCILFPLIYTIYTCMYMYVYTCAYMCVHTEKRRRSRAEEERESVVVRTIDTLNPLSQR